MTLDMGDGRVWRSGENECALRKAGALFMNRADLL